MTSKNPHSSLHKFQKAFTQHIRHPQKNKRPHKISSSRMQVYNELLFNNIEDCLATCYPILKKKLGKIKWNKLTRDFFHKHSAQTPYYRRIPEEFFLFLKNRKQKHELPYLLDLAYYEWIELDLYLRKESKTKKIKAKKNLLKNIFKLNPVSALFHSPYPLHQPDKLSLKHKPQTYFFYFAFRNSKDEVQILNLSAAEAQLLEWMNKKNKTAEELLFSLQKKMKIKDTVTFLKWGESIFKNFKACEIALN